MTARRRRKSGTGPSATALIAWLGGPPSTAAHAAVPGPGDHNPVSALRRLLAGRARGVAAGTLLACGSVLAVAAHAGDSTLLPSEPESSPSPAPSLGGGPAASSVSAGYAPASTPPTTSQPGTSAFADTGATLGGAEVRGGQVHRNAPLTVTTPSPSPSPAPAPPSTPADPTQEQAADGPVGEVADAVVGTVRDITRKPPGSSTPAPREATPDGPLDLVDAVEDVTGSLEGLVAEPGDTDAAGAEDAAEPDRSGTAAPTAEQDATLLGVLPLP